MTERIIQRCVFPRERRLTPLYHRLDRPQNSRALEPTPADRFSMTIGRGCKLITDTYFNSFFESYWRRYTRLGRLRLRLEVEGRGTALLLRRSLAAGLSILESVDFDAESGTVDIDIPEPQLHFRESGALHFDIIARSSRVRLRKAEWRALDVEAGPMRLVAGFCTFNREKFLIDNVRALLADPGVVEVLERIVVVDQGTSRVRDHPDFDELEAAVGAKLQVVEQGNFGGTGGFTRSILEARAIPGATHMLLMDDDAVTEPESVFRAAAFQALARDEIGVGGQMLDMLRPMEVYESGALVDPGSLGVKTPIHRQHAEHAVGLAPFLEVSYTHYNAWWFFAFPLRVIDRVGLPLPLFIRGDDVEFGYRLHAAGIPTATVPGMGIWHEPFYLKRGGWQAYYDLRNMLVLTSIHFPMDRRHVVKTFLRRLITQLLSLNYFEAAILCEAVDDYCQGPEVMEADPRQLHQKLLALKRTLAMDSVPRARCLPIVQPPGPPTTKAQVRWLLLRCLIRQFTEASPPAHVQPDHVIPDDYARWWLLARRDVVAAEDWHTESHRIYRRSRESFLAILKHGLKSAHRLYRAHGRVAADWRAAFGRLTGAAFWDRYLGIERDAGAVEDRDRRAA